MAFSLEALQKKIQVLGIDAGLDIPTLTVSKEQLLLTLKTLYHDQHNPFQFLTDLCGVHYPDSTPPVLGVVYHLHCLTQNIRLRIKAFTPVNDPTFPSVTGLFATANWMERETYDFFGIQFQGHPNLTRILNVDDMDYFPLRKEYALEDATREDKQDAYFGR